MVLSTLHTKLYILINHDAINHVLFTAVFHMWNHKASLLMESDAFTKSIKHKYNLSLLALEYLTCLDYENLIYCFCSFSKSHLKQGQFFLWCNNQSLSLCTRIINWIFPKTSSSEIPPHFPGPLWFPFL